MVESVSFSPFDAYRSGFYSQAAALSGSCLLAATGLILERYHCYSHIVLNVAMTLFHFSSLTFLFSLSSFLLLYVSNEP